MKLHLASAPTDNPALVRCEGDVTSPPVGANLLADLLGPNWHGWKVLLDMKSATFIDSAGIGWLLNLQKQFSDGDGMLVMHSVPSVVKDVFDLLRLEAVFRIAKDVDAAHAMVAD